MTEHVRLAGESEKPIVRRMSLTEASVQTLVCPLNRPRVYVYDTKAPGLAVQVMRTGAKAYYFVGRVRGEHQALKHRLGDVAKLSLDNARRAAVKVTNDALNGINPAAARRDQAAAARKTETLLQLWERYRDDHLKPVARNSTLVSDESRWRTHLVRWASKRINTITAEAIAGLHAEITKASRADGFTGNAADKAVKLLRRMFTFGKIKPNPAAGAVKFHGDEERQRFLTREEAGRLLVEVEKSKFKKTADAIKFALFTGARSGNVCSARWQDVHLDDGIWIIPKDQSKNGRPLTINLPPPAIDLLRERMAEAKPGAVYVFPGHVEGRPLTTLDGAWQEVKTRAKLHDVHLHDLRHTLASWMAMSGTSLLMVGRQLGHASKQSTARYAHLEASAVKEATAVALATFMPKPAALEVPADQPPVPKRKPAQRKRPRQ